MNKFGIGKSLSIVSIYVLSSFLILASLFWTFITLSGEIERDMGWEPLSFDIFIYLFKFVMPALSVQFYLGLLIFILGLFLNFKLWKRRSL